MWETVRIMLQSGETVMQSLYGVSLLHRRPLSGGELATELWREDRGHAVNGSLLDSYL